MTLEQARKKLNTPNLLEWERERILQYIHYLETEKPRTSAKRPKKNYTSKGPAANKRT